MTETLEHKIFEVVIRGEHTSRRGFNSEIEKRFGTEGKIKVIELWNKGCFTFNKYGYINPSKRGYIFWQDNVLPPKRAAKLKLTTSQYLDYLWTHNQVDFEKWLVSKGYVKETRRDKQ